MVKPAHKLKSDPSIATTISEQICHQTPSLFDLFPHETGHLLQKLHQLNQEQKGNNIDLVSALLQEFWNHTISPGIKVLSASDDFLDTFFKAMLGELQELNSNIASHGVNIRSALDAYTLNYTTRVIATVHEFIEEQGLMHIQKKSFIFTKYPKADMKITSREVSLAQRLKDECEQIRSQIGSSDAMPKGLVIDFVVHLFEAMHEFEKLYQHKCSCKSQKLICCIQETLNQIRRFYPDLAEAGEELEKAMAIYGFQEPKFAA